MRCALIGLSIWLGAVAPVQAQVGVTVSIPGVSIGIHQPAYPDLVLVPGYPVYYAPHVPVNYFFYDGLYWVYQNDNWYVSSWYNGPWDLVEPDDVPLSVLRVPVGYYVQPPVYFSGWVVTAAPRWHYHWGPRWTRYHHGWDHRDRHVVHHPAPLPAYQRHYHGDRYPRPEYQRVIRHEHYHYQPRDQAVRRHFQQRQASRPQVQAQPAAQNPPLRYGPYSQPEQRPQREREETRRSEPMQVLPSQRNPVAQEQQQVPERRARQQSPAQPNPAVQRVQPQQREQRESRERTESRRSEGMQVLPQQRAAILQERQQQQQQRQEQIRAQQSPRPQQTQGRGERHQGQERGRDRGQGRQ